MGIKLLSVLARKSESGAVSCFILAGDGYHPPAFGVLERNLLASSGPTEFSYGLTVTKELNNEMPRVSSKTPTHRTATRVTFPPLGECRPGPSWTPPPPPGHP